ncbi:MULTISPECIES: hypothetical protein [Leifsonia]|uniref:DUF4190 domain-containing protein n=1 Tax=Leifsonia soli TaxID=582665 RepID=A0A852SW74_9MICO|nr:MULTISPECIES: hypothetical protein [Leifsonia]NYD72961.1 hypothetical protein [Leifsonia soli]SEA94283.1 hypothetical protein SAMN04515680_2240 [Leifsonia sp. 21MFCrub1.1]
MTTTTPYQTAAPVRTLSITSFVLGLASIVFGWTFVAPVAGLVVGILALGREPLGKTFAVWGIVLNAVMLAGVAFFALLALVGMGIGAIALPFAWL